MYLYPTFKKNMDNTVGMIIHIYYNLLQKFFESANSSCEKEMIRTHTQITQSSDSPLLPRALFILAYSSFFKPSQLIWSECSPWNLTCQDSPHSLAT